MAARALVAGFDGRTAMLLAVITGVVQVGQHPEMGRIDAPTYAARVIDGHSLWNLPVDVNPGCPMGRDDLPVPVVLPPDLGVTVRSDGVVADPTPVVIYGHPCCGTFCNAPWNVERHLWLAVASYCLHATSIRLSAYRRPVPMYGHRPSLVEFCWGQNPGPAICGVPQSLGAPCDCPDHASWGAAPKPACWAPLKPPDCWGWD